MIYPLKRSVPRLLHYSRHLPEPRPPFRSPNSFHRPRDLHHALQKHSSRPRTHRAPRTLSLCPRRFLSTPLLLLQLFHLVFHFSFCFFRFCDFTTEVASRDGKTHHSYRHRQVSLIERWSWLLDCLP